MSPTKDKDDPRDRDKERPTRDDPRPDQELPEADRPRPDPHARSTAEAPTLLGSADRLPPSSQHVSHPVRVEQQGTRTPPPADRPTATPRGTTSGLKVRAFSMGYYGEVRRRIGDVFTLADPQDFSPRWMETVDGSTPERITTGNQALRAQHDEEMRARHSPGLQTGRDDVHDVPPGTANPLGSVRSVSGRE